jgi:hypothetical protein
VCLAVLMAATAQSAHAAEGQWQLGPQLGYSLAAIPDGPAHGFGGGPLFLYGVHNYVNLRGSVDVIGFDFPDPATGAVLVNGAVGAEAVFEVIQVVPFIGATIGPAALALIDADDIWHLGIEFPGGLRYHPARDLALGVEARYRLLLLGEDTSPMHNFVAFASVAYVGGY